MLIAVYMSRFFLDTRKALFSAFLKNVTLQTYVTVYSHSLSPGTSQVRLQKVLEMHMAVKLGSHLYHHQATFLCSA